MRIEPHKVPCYYVYDNGNWVEGDPLDLERHEGETRPFSDRIKAAGYVLTDRIAKYEQVGSYIDIYMHEGMPDWVVEFTPSDFSCIVVVHTWPNFVRLLNELAVLVTLGLVEKGEDDE
jgi:hypothetical protein